MHDVAPLIRVSQTTVSFVLHGREEADISDETKAPYSAATWLLSLNNLIRGTHHANASGRARPLTHAHRRERQLGGFTSWSGVRQRALTKLCVYSAQQPHNLEPSAEGAIVKLLRGVLR